MFIPLSKVDMTKRLVYGTIGAEEVDHSGEILDYESAKAAFQKWSDEQHKASGGKSFGNVRAMHSRIAAGKLSEPLQFDDAAKKIHACAYISDDAEWQKVLDGVYTGFSPGGGYAKRSPDKAQPHFMRYTPSVVEVSIVDVPCQPSATFACVKADGTEEMRKFKDSEEVGDLDQGFRAKDGRFFKAKDTAKRWNRFLEEMAKAQAEYTAALNNDPALAALKKAEAAVDSLEKGDPAENEDDDNKKKPVKNKKYHMKKVAGDDMQKGFCNVARLAEIIGEMHWLLESVECEQEMEGDKESEQPDMMAEAVNMLVEIITAMVAEEGNELEAMMADKTIDLPRNVAESLVKMIGADHKLSKKFKIIEPAAPVVVAEVDELKKNLQSVTDDLGKKTQLVSELTSGVDKLTKRLEALERQPMPIRGALRAVSREHERAPAPELKKDTSQKPRAIRPSNLSPRDAMAWERANNPENK
jgi:hypothetical protein